MATGGYGPFLPALNIEECSAETLYLPFCLILLIINTYHDCLTGTV